MQMVQDNTNRWQMTLEQFMHTVDGLGTPIDPKILDIVVALNVAGFNTTGLCEGHLDELRLVG